MSITHKAPPSVRPTECAPESVCAAIEHIAASAPDAEALSMAGRSISYSELNSRANRLADHLCLQGVGPEVPVGLLCGRGFEAIIGTLAILKADGVSVPFDATLPAERLRVMISLAGLRLIVTTEAMQYVRPGLGGPAALVRLEGECPPAPNLQPRIRPENTSHVHFTSGPNGRPRAVPVTHAAAENLARWQQRTIPFRRGMRVVQFSPPGLDSAWQEIAGSLCAGATLVMPAAADLATGRSLAAMLARERVERAILPAATLAQLADAVVESAMLLPELRDIIVTCPPVLVTSEMRSFFLAHPACRLHVQYGHTETLAALGQMIEGSPTTWPGILPLGKPVHGITARVLDPNGEPVAAGEAGELWIGGSHLPRGYHRDPTSNRERFRLDPWAPEGSTARIFRTGDRVRETAPNTFEFASVSPPPQARKARRRSVGQPAAPVTNRARDTEARAVA